MTIERETFRDDVIASMMADGWNGRGPWYFKDPKILICREYFLRFFPDAKWVYVFRSSDATLRSIDNASFMSAYDSEIEWVQYLHKYDRWWLEVMMRAKNSMIFDMDNLIKRDEGKLSELFHFCGLGGIPDFDHIDMTQWR